jgi:hypothetical protein
MNDKFITKDGFLSVYALSCGYMEQLAINNKQVTLWADCGIYHVRGHDFNEHKRIFWNTYQKLTVARKAYKKAIKDNLKGQQK